MALGAAVGEAVLGHRVGRKAALWGAVCGTLPDLDVLVPFSDPVAAFTYHRSFSHSLIVMALATPLMVWLIRKVHPVDARHRKGWFVLVYLAFATHALLDACTIYGTQIFWPLGTPPATWGTLFIIDPLVTLPLIVGLSAVALMRRQPARAWRVNLLMLGVSSAYVAFSVAAKLHVQSVARQELARQELPAERFVSLASPFNTVLWRIVAVDGDDYLVGWHSLLDASATIRFRRYPRNAGLLNSLESHWPVERLRWFTKGFFKVTRDGDDIWMTDLRMGVENAYVFSFKVARIGNPHPLPSATEMRSSRPDMDRLGDLWRRLLGDTSVRLEP